MRSKRQTCFKFVSSRWKAEVKTPISVLTGGRLKAEAFGTSEIFQVREESESSGGGATMVIGSRTVKYLGH
jgi:hypothetical protein